MNKLLSLCCLSFECIYDKDKTGTWNQTPHKSGYMRFASRNNLSNFSYTQETVTDEGVCVSSSLSSQKNTMLVTSLRREIETQRLITFVIKQVGTSSLTDKVRKRTGSVNHDTAETHTFHNLYLKVCQLCHFALGTFFLDFCPQVTFSIQAAYKSLLLCWDLQTLTPIIASSWTINNLEHLFGWICQTQYSDCQGQFRILYPNCRHLYRTVNVIVVVGFSS